MNIGKSIKTCRIQKGLTQNALSDELSFSSSYLSLIEKGKREPSLSILNEISNALSVPLSILVFLGSDKTEISSIPSELSEKLSSLTLNLLADE